MTAMLPSLAGSNIIYGMGMLEMGMTMSYEQLLIDGEIARMIRRVIQGIPVNDVTMAVEMIKKVGPGGTYLGERHTLKHMRQESSQVNLIDRRMYEAWLKNGGEDIAARANRQAREILANYKPEPLAPAHAKAIRDIIDEAAQACAEEAQRKEARQ